MSENRTMLQDKKRKIRTPFSKDVLIFLFCMLLATLFWFLNTLSKTTEHELTIPIKYKNIPAQYIVSAPLCRNVKVKVKDLGFSILIYHFTHKDSVITIDLKNRFSRDKRIVGINPKELKENVLNILNPTMSLINIEPKDLEIKYEKLYEKELQVILNGDINLSQQYILKGEVQLVPSKITVYGSKSILDTMSAIQTKHLSIKDINTSKRIITYPQPIHNIRFQTNRIQVIIPVELFTEKTITIPIIGKNVPNNIKLRTFPATVNVSFFVGLSKFNLIKPNDIQAYIDFNSIVDNKEGKQIVKLNTSISYITNLNQSPKMVEYILEEK